MTHNSLNKPNPRRFRASTTRSRVIIYRYAPVNSRTRKRPGLLYQDGTGIVVWTGLHSSYCDDRILRRCWVFQVTWLWSMLDRSSRVFLLCVHGTTVAPSTPSKVCTRIQVGSASQGTITTAHFRSAYRIDSVGSLLVMVG